MAAVYEIRNKVNGKVYIGSTIRPPRDRRKAHWSSLRKGDHHNPHLQCAWNKYGENAFEFNVLEELDCPEAEIRELETQYIRQARERLGERGVYTILEGQANPFADPEIRKRLEPVVAEACRQRWKDEKFRAKRVAELKSDEFRRAVSERMQSLWQDDQYATHQAELLRNANAREYPGLVSPTGEVFAPIRNLSAFCRDKGLPVGSVHAIARGKGRAKSYKGWRRYDPSGNNSA